MTWWFYAVAVGATPGVYASWRAAREEVQYFPKAQLKKFRTFAGAEQFLRDHECLRFAVDPVADERRKMAPRRPHPRNKSTLVAFCDGANAKSTVTSATSRARAAFACVFPYATNWNKVEVLEGPAPTRYRADFLAALAAMRRANLEDPSQTRLLYIFTPSRYLVRAMTVTLRAWLRNGWRRADGFTTRNRDVVGWLLEEQGRREVEYCLVDNVSLDGDEWERRWLGVATQAALQAATWASGTLTGLERGSDLARYEAVCVSDTAQGGRVAFAAVFPSKEQWNRVGEVLEPPLTREHALYLAVLTAIESVNRDDPENEFPLLIFLDNSELLQTMTRKMAAWVDNGWHGVVTDRPLLQQIAKAMERRHVSWRSNADRAAGRRFGSAHQLTRRFLAGRLPAPYTDPSRASTQSYADSAAT